MTGNLPPDDEGTEDTGYQPTATDSTNDGTNDGDGGAADEEDTVREPFTCMGEYPDISAFLRASIEPLVEPSIAWILDYLDYEAVLERFEGGTYRFYWQDGHVFRMG